MSLINVVQPKKVRHMLANGSTKLRPCAPLLICCFPPHAHSAPHTHTLLLGGLAATTLRGGASPLSSEWSKLQAALLVFFLLSSLLFLISSSLGAVAVQVYCVLELRQDSNLLHYCRGCQRKSSSRWFMTSRFSFMFVAYSKLSVPVTHRIVK